MQDNRPTEDTLPHWAAHALEMCVGGEIAIPYSGVCFVLVDAKGGASSYKHWMIGVEFSERVVLVEFVWDRRKDEIVLWYGVAGFSAN